MASVELKQDGRVAIMTIDDGARNALNGSLLEEIRTTLARIATDPEIGALVVTGNSKFFMNGLDIGWMKTLKIKEGYAFLVDVTKLLKETALFPLPVIGAISGHAFGLGAIWASGFDYRMMNSEKGWVCFPEMTINIPFSPGMIALCEHGLGKTTFRKMAWSAERYTGEEALDIGYASSIHTYEELLPAASALATGLGKRRPEAFAYTKIAFAEGTAAILERDPEALKTIPVKISQ